MSTKVVHVREPYDVYIGRGSEWGNPYRIGTDGTREEVIAKFRRDLLEGLTHPDTRGKLRLAIRKLRGKRLGCYCAPRPCHGDVLAEFADAE
jgi:hypothetical protein